MSADTIWESVSFQLPLKSSCLLVETRSTRFSAQPAASAVITAKANTRPGHRLIRRIIAVSV
jgi:hypothetical protein